MRTFIVDQRLKIFPASFVKACTAVCLLFTMSGCGDNTEAIRAVQEAVQTSARMTGNRDSSFDAEDELDSLPLQKFVPINPHRQNPFELPASNNSENATPFPSSVNSASASQVLVLGFADVGKPRVMLRIGDQTKIMKVGDESMNVEVVEISPPRVVLKMDNLTWTATMFDDRTK